MSCGSGVLVKSDARGHELVACRCRCWTCEKCGPQRQRQFEDQIASGNPETLLTMTWPAKAGRSPLQARRLMALAWKKFVARVRRKYPGQEFEYSVAVEAHLSGFPHFHVAMRAPYIPRDWISAVWLELTGAWHVDIRAVNSVAGVASYVAKYMAKQPAKFGTGKRYWFSQGYRPVDDDGPVFDRRHEPWRWSRNHIVQEVVDLAGRGLVPLWVTPDHALLVRVFDP